MQTDLAKVLSYLGIAALKPMQQTARTTILKEKATVLIAPTGSGKTIGFLLPLIDLIDAEINSVQCLILVPSRELALQIEQVWKKMNTGLKVNVCYGGHSTQTEINNFSNPPALLIGTPGRITDHLRKGSFSTANIKTLVLDEFDKSLELGFQEDMSFIIRQLKQLTKKVLVSATSLKEIPEFAGVASPAFLNFTEDKNTADLTMKLVLSEDRDKVETLFQLLCSLHSEPALMFCNHRESCERTCAYLISKGIEAAFYHGGMEQDDRERALVKFRNGTVNYLVTTDLAARGLDIPEMKNVIHFQLPVKAEEFLHRNGRTARMQAKGTTYIILFKEDDLPAYIEEPLEKAVLSANGSLPEPPLFETIYISGGRKNKLNKFDIVGALIQKGKLQKEDVGLIEVKDFMAFAAIKKEKAPGLLLAMKEEKIKGKKYKIAIAK